MAAEVELKYTGCKSSGVACKTGSVAEEIVVKGASLQVVRTTSKENDLLLTTMPLTKITCASVAVEVEGKFEVRITPEDELLSEYNFVAEAKEGKQSPDAEILVLVGKPAEQKYEDTPAPRLDAKFGATEAFEEITEQGTLTVKLNEAGEFV